MIKVAELKDTGKPSYHVREDINLKMIKLELKWINQEEYGLPIRFYFDQIKSGGLFNSSVEKCLILENEVHPTDYFKYCITIRKQGRLTMVMMNYYGSSRLTGKANQTEERRRSGTLGGMIINAIAGVNQAELQEEYDYYGMIEEMFDSLFNAC